nr:HTATSF1 [Diplonema papillatum]
MQIERVPELYSFLEDTEALRLGVAKSRQKPAPPAAGEPGDASAAKPSKRKRKDAAAAGDKKPTEWFNLKVNTSVYVSELPAGTTAAQLSAFFKKVGVIKRDPLTNTEKVKVYDRGDGLVTFVRPESVDLAVQLLDGALFNEERHARVRVEPAKFEKKGDAYQPRQDLAAYDRQMKKAKKATESQQLAWKETDADPNARTVAVKNVFHPDEIAEQPTVSNVIKQDMREECAKFGHVENVRVLPNSAEGVVLIRFKSFISAQDCIRKFDGRMYAHQPLKAYMWDHEEQFETIEAAPPSKKQDADSFSGDELEC